MEAYFHRHSEDVIRLWALSYARLTEGRGMGLPAEAAARVILTHLREHQDLPALLHAYAGDIEPDVELINTLVTTDEGSELPWIIRDAAYHLRWQELITQP